MGRWLKQFRLEGTSIQDSVPLGSWPLRGTYQILDILEKHGVTVTSGDSETTSCFSSSLESEQPVITTIWDSDNRDVRWRVSKLIISRDESECTHARVLVGQADRYLYASYRNSIAHSSISKEMGLLSRRLPLC
jgi:hypothetical protein